MIPTGTSKPPISERAIVSERSINIAPNTNEALSKNLCSLPKISLMKCGTISPTKPMIPLTYTAMDVRSAQISSMFLFNTFVFSPIASASSSPITRTFKSLPWYMVKNMPTTVGTSIVNTWFQLFALKLPMVQVIIFIASS